MYIQQTTHSYGPLSMPMFVKPSDDGRTVTVRWGVGGDVHLALSPDEAERLRDGLTAALDELAEMPTRARSMHVLAAELAAERHLLTRTQRRMTQGGAS